MAKLGNWTKRTLAVLAVMLGGPALAAVTGVVDIGQDWRTANRDSVGLSPTPADEPEAVLQVLGGRAFGWRGAFAVHTWIASKRRGASHYTTYQVIGWYAYGGGSPLVVRRDLPDRRWYGADPELYLDLRGPQVEALIDKVEAAVAAYPFKRGYRAWPGPNSNSFTAWVGRAVPELRLDLPPTAVGKDWLGTTSFAAKAPSGTGYQLSLLGVLGVTAAVEEGLELNLLGLGLGVDPLDLALRLPGIGRVPNGAPATAVRAD